MSPADIQRVYEELGYEAGWRFMSCPESMIDSADLAFVFLNPGGTIEDGQPSWDQPLGNSYWVESWPPFGRGEAPLQSRVQHLAQIFGVQPDRIFSAHFVPFRSPTWQALEHKRQALKFSVSLWRYVLERLSARKIVCVGKGVAGRQIVELCDAKLEETVQMGWGKQTYDVYRGRDNFRILSVPHLSRFHCAGQAHRERILRSVIGRM